MLIDTMASNSENNPFHVNRLVGGGGETCNELLTEHSDKVFMNYFINFILKFS